MSNKATIRALLILFALCLIVIIGPYYCFLPT
jgi:hypothetical protein